MGVINTNLPSLNTQRNLSASSSDLNTSIQRLSSGMRVNSAKDDAAGLSIATRIDSQVRGMNVAMRNSNDAISLAQVAEGALGKVTDSLQRMRELAVQSANATNSAADRDNLNKEYTQLQAEITRVTTSTKFNGNVVLDGSARDFQVGADTTDVIRVSGANMNDAASNVAIAATDAFSLNPGGVAGAQLDGTAATAAITQLDLALAEVNTERANFGAVQNRFSSVIGNLQVSVENQSASKSRIMDADFASETAKLSRAQILQQAGTAMLGQANSLPNGVLALLRG